MNELRWRRVLVSGCAALLAACGSSNALGPGGGGLTPTSAIEPVGEPYYAGWIGFPVVGNHPVHVRRVTVLGVPDGLVVVGTYAVSMRESNNPGQAGHYISGGDEAHVRAFYPRLRLRPVTDAVFQPVGLQDWYILEVLKPIRPGTFTTAGLQIDYDADGQTGSQTYPDRVTVRCAAGATFAPFPPSPRP